MDLVPGMVTRFWFTPTRTGTFVFLCAGSCGVGHPQMRGNVVIDNKSDYQVVAAEASRPSLSCRLPKSESVVRSRGKAQSRTRILHDETQARLSLTK